MLLTKQFWFPLTCVVFCAVNQNCLVSNTLQNLFLYVHQMNESHTGLECREDE